jgi:ectoine hydroxylase-related dioxygenase (phytanoyl-CoA dioxygenase family)
VVISAWIAVTDSTPEMGCVQIIPGSHQTVVPHVALGRDDELPSNFVKGADPAAYNPLDAVSVPMRAGEAILFNERTLHHSAPNITSQRRIGLAVRVVPPLVRVLSYDAEWHKLVPVSGCPSSRLSFNEYTQPELRSATGSSSSRSKI